MRSALWILALFACAVTAALFLGSNRATVTLFWHPWRIDLSLNLLLIALTLLFGLSALLAYAIASVWRMPAEAKVWREHRHDLAAHHALARAAALLSQGQQSQAEQEIAHMQQLLATLHPPASPREAQEQHTLRQASQGLHHWLHQSAPNSPNAQDDSHPSSKITYQEK